MKTRSNSQGTFRESGNNRSNNQGLLHCRRLEQTSGYKVSRQEATFREHSGNIQGKFREHSGNIQGIREQSKQQSGTAALPAPGADQRVQGIKTRSNRQGTFSKS
jgi:hypothetical protein